MKTHTKVFKKQGSSGINYFLPLLILIVFSFRLQAQASHHFLVGKIKEPMNAEILVSQMISGKSEVVAHYFIAPSDSEFVYAIPQKMNENARYTFQINLLKPGGKGYKLDRICTFRPALQYDKDYSVQITPSKLDTIKKKGFELKTTSTDAELSCVSGQIITTKNKTDISFDEVENGSIVSGNVFSSDKSGNFSIGYRVKQDAFYYLTSENWQARIFLKPSDKLSLQINDLNGETISVNGSKENMQLFNWQQLIKPITDYGYYLQNSKIAGINWLQYISAYKQLLPKIDAFASSQNFNIESVFTKGFSQIQVIDKNIVALKLLNQISINNKTELLKSVSDNNDVIHFYEDITQSEKFTDKNILLLGETVQYMKWHTMLYAEMKANTAKKELAQSERLKYRIECIANDTLRACFLQTVLKEEHVNNLTEFNSVFAPFQSYTKFESVKKEYINVFSSFISDTAFVGKPVADFMLLDTARNQRSFKEFAGKVVFVDVWASWCGPCKEQIPHLKEIEEEYKGKNVAFVSVSIDKIQDRDKWLALINKEKIGGIHLIDDLGKTFGRKYNISAIPRFLLLDKNGKWLEMRCPRPSAKADLEKYINNALAE